MCEISFPYIRRSLLAGRLLILFFLLVATEAFGKETVARDTVYLKNGEVVIGDIKTMRLGMLSFDSDDVGTVDLKISKIKTISSASDTLRIEMASKAIYFGALKPSVKTGWVYIVTPTYRHLVQIDNINTLLTLEPNFWQNLSGNVSAGFSYSRSSDIGQLNLSASATYTMKRVDFSITGSGIASIDSASFSRDREDLDLTVLYNIKNMWYAVGSIDYQRNLQLSIARRFQETAAAGYKVMFSQNFQLLGVGGFSVSQERSTTGIDQNFLWEVPIGFTVDYFKFSHPDMQISSGHVFYAGLTQWGRVRYDSNTTFAWQLFKDFDFSLNLYLNYDNRPPDTSSSGKMDYGMVVGLTYKF